MADQALSGVKILDLTHHIAGSYCTKILADYGADVIKIERPGSGDPARSMGPFLDDDPHPEKSGLFLHLNSNKRSVTLNLKTESGQRILKAMVKWADILVENFRPKVMPSLGLDYETLRAINPCLVMTSISNFGQTGPYRDYEGSELVVQGMGHDMYSCGVPDRQPLKLGGNVIQYQAGNVASLATMLSYYAAEVSGEGEHLDISILEVCLASIDRRAAALVGYQYTGDIGLREPPRGVGFPYGVHECADGFFDIMGVTIYFPKVCEMMGMPELAVDPRFDTLQKLTNIDNRGEFEAYFLPWCFEHTKREIWDAAQKAHVLLGPVNTAEDLFTDLHWEARGYFAEVDHPVMGRVKQPGPPIRMAESPWEIRRVAPLLGQHNGEVLAQFGYDKGDQVRLRERGII